jgi:hypothetical protein
MNCLVQACHGRLFIFTYHYTPGQPKKRHPFRKLNALRDAPECRAFFGRYVEDLHEALTFKDQGLFVGVLSRDAKMRLHDVPTINVALEKRKRSWWQRSMHRLQRTIGVRSIRRSAADAHL